MISEEVMKDAVSMVRQLEVPYLQELQTVISNELVKRKKDAMRDAAVEVQKIAARVGMSVDQLVQLAIPVKTTKTAKTVKPVSNPVPPKYRNPDDVTKTWAGRGRVPSWVKAFAEANNNDLSGIEINK